MRLRRQGPDGTRWNGTRGRESSAGRSSCWKRRWAKPRALLTQIPYAETRAEAERPQTAFQAWATKKGVAVAGQRLAEDWERLVTFYAFPQVHWKHLRTTNVVESPFAAVRLRTGAAKRFKKVESATAAIWKTLGVAEQRFRRLDDARVPAGRGRGRHVRRRSACDAGQREGRRLIFFYTLVDKSSRPIPFDGTP